MNEVARNIDGAELVAITPFDDVSLIVAEYHFADQLPGAENPSRLYNESDTTVRETIVVVVLAKIVREDVDTNINGNSA